MRVKKGMVSYVKPVHIDIETSPTTVYVARNIKTGEKQTLEVETDKFKDITTYTYDLYIYTRAEFELVEEYLYIDEQYSTVVNKLTELERNQNDLLQQINELKLILNAKNNQ